MAPRAAEDIWHYDKVLGVTEISATQLDAIVQFSKGDKATANAVVPDTGCTWIAAKRACQHAEGRGSDQCPGIREEAVREERDLQ